ncbi:hypothetical protein QE152_g8242 [Popillia japonica]|uniref:Uncharacterized protein n=1 Tax=Popillia japonica TaxID=7064 RepID=A0AAW1MC90_POPJA
MTSRQASTLAADGHQVLVYAPEWGRVGECTCAVILTRLAGVEGDEDDPPFLFLLEPGQAALISEDVEQNGSRGRRGRPSLSLPVGARTSSSNKRDCRSLIYFMRASSDRSSTPPDTSGRRGPPQTHRGGEVLECPRRSYVQATEMSPMIDLHPHPGASLEVGWPNIEGLIVTESIVKASSLNKFTGKEVKGDEILDSDFTSEASAKVSRDAKVTFAISKFHHFIHLSSNPGYVKASELINGCLWHTFPLVHVRNTKNRQLCFPKSYAYEGSIPTLNTKLEHLKTLLQWVDEDEKPFYEAIINFSKTKKLKNKAAKKE